MNLYCDETRMALGCIKNIYIFFYFSRHSENGKWSPTAGQSTLLSKYSLLETYTYFLRAQQKNVLAMRYLYTEILRASIQAALLSWHSIKWLMNVMCLSNIVKFSTLQCLRHLLLFALVQTSSFQIQIKCFFDNSRNNQFFLHPITNIHTLREKSTKY